VEKGVGSLGLFKVTDHVWVRPEAVTGVEVKGTKDNLKSIIIYTRDGRAIPVKHGDKHDSLELASRLGLTLPE
jgi:hypothetical protein